MRLLFLTICIVSCFLSSARTIRVTNSEELRIADQNAKPGDTILLANGTWKDIVLKLTGSGTEGQPVVFRAEKAGRVIISGHSQLKIGGNYLVIEGLFFENGYAGNDAVIDFQTGKDHVANHCRVTNCVINDFNNPKRVEENSWVSFSGKNNRVDHCSFINKKNFGVLMAVLLDDDRSRENFHSIDHNYFGIRPPLGSNGGEIIRVGLAQHCQYNSNTQIVDNFFEHCDGETEIISIKSGSNAVRNNLFTECQGGVVLRHGNNNTVENNIFLGNGKEGTGGVRIINRGQWVVNNLFFKCRGIDFRSPLSVMNGVPNSPPTRYVQVTDAVISNNSFYDCSPISFCEGSDAERSLPPDHVLFVNNIFYNTTDSAIYHAYDDINGFQFTGNKVSSSLSQTLATGFIKTALSSEKQGPLLIPKAGTGTLMVLNDSLRQASLLRLHHELSSKTGFSDMRLAQAIQSEAHSACGANWFNKNNSSPVKNNQTVSCATTADIYTQLEKARFPIVLRLTGTEYNFDNPLAITGPVCFTSGGGLIRITTSEKISCVFEVRGKGILALKDLHIDGSGVKATHFISSEREGGVEHFALSIEKCRISGLSEGNGCQDIFYACKSSYADSILVKNSEFSQCRTNGFMMNAEKENKGLYSAEKIVLSNDLFELQDGMLLDIYRGGTDESTMGPSLLFTNNRVRLENTTPIPWIQLTGAQKTIISNNNFITKDPAQTFIIYKDLVRAHHWLTGNKIPGKVETNAFVISRNNSGVDH